MEIGGCVFRWVGIANNLHGTIPEAMTRHTLPMLNKILHRIYHNRCSLSFCITVKVKTA